MRRFVVAGAGAWYDAPDVRPDDFLVAADGGCARLAAAGLRPDLVVGDFDSGEEPAGLDVVRLPVMKDDTDMLAALRIGLAKGYTRFALYGGTGGRGDHTLANIQCLHLLAAHGARGVLYGEKEAMTVIRDGEIRFPEGARGTLSVFALTDRALGVCIEGAKYPLSDAVLTSDFPIGVSNCFTGEPARVSVRQGALLLVYPREVRVCEEI